MAKGKAMVVAARRPASRVVTVLRTARRGASKLQEHRKQVKGMAIAAAAAGVFGYMQAKDVKVPKIDALGTTGTYGLAAAAVYAVTDSDMAAHIATGLLSVAIYNAAQGRLSSAGVADIDSAGSYTIDD